MKKYQCMYRWRWKYLYTGILKIIRSFEGRISIKQTGTCLISTRKRQEPIGKYGEIMFSRALSGS